MKKLTLILVALGGGLLFIGCDRSPEKIADKITRKIQKKLDLNEEQSLKLDKIKVAILEERKAMKERKKTHKEDIKKLLLSDKLEKQKVKSLIDERKTLFDTKFDKYFPLIEDFHASLNAEQKKEVVELMEKFHKKRRKHWH